MAIRRSYKLSLAVTAARERTNIKGMTRADQQVFVNVKRKLDDAMNKVRSTFYVVV